MVASADVDVHDARGPPSRARRGGRATSPAIPARTSFNGGAGTATECHQLGVSDAILAGALRRGARRSATCSTNSGTASQFAGSYEPSWGRLKAITHPAVGNHEYGSPGAAPYFQYFGAAAGDPDKGYYSYDLGSWHLIALNSNCAQIGGCAPARRRSSGCAPISPRTRARCTLAYWHHPRFSSGQARRRRGDRARSGSDLVRRRRGARAQRPRPRLRALRAAGRRRARATTRSGIREFVVGTGGKNHMTFKAAIQPNSEVRDTSSFGFLALTLGDGAYSWRFVSDPPGGFSDSGSAACH